MLDLIEVLVVNSYPLYLSILKEPSNKNNPILRIYYYQNNQYRKNIY